MDVFTDEDIKKRYPVSQFEHKSFPFTKSELMQLVSLEVQQLLIDSQQKDIQRLVNLIIDQICLKRVGVTEVDKVGKTYDTSSGYFHVYIPRPEKKVTPKTEVI